MAQHEIEISFEKTQELDTDNEESKHSLSTMIPGQLEAFCLKEFCNKLSIPKYILALKTDEQRMKIKKIGNSFRLKTDKGKPWKISTYTAHEESYDDKAAVQTETPEMTEERKPGAYFKF